MGEEQSLTRVPHFAMRLEKVVMMVEVDEATAKQVVAVDDIVVGNDRSRSNYCY